jgi:diguanylate cyclase (GGDEF)-like protein/PAS domain S-box-containing protein
LLCQAGWENACSRFHRVNPETAKRCQDSNLAIMHDLRDGAVGGGKCQNGLIDYATPVVVEGQQVATLFLGQFLHEPPNMEFFRVQAARFGFDEDEYLKAIAAIPVVDKAQIESTITLMVEIAQMLAKSELTRIRQIKLEKKLTAHAERRIELEDILDSSPVAIGWSDGQGRVEYINRQFTHLFGYRLDDLPDIETWYCKAYPDQHYRDTVIRRWFNKVELSHKTGTPPPELEANVTCKNGTVRRVLIHVSWVGERRLVNFSDITEHWLSEQRKLAHDAMLEMVARGSPLPEILNVIVQEIQSEEKTSLCSILLMDAEGKHLLTGAAPSLPAFYNKAINGVEIGLGVGSCGTAAYLGQRVVVEDITTHDYWKPYAQLAKEAGLGACWSEPILSSRGKVLGTFAIYHAKPTRPTPDDIERISFAANLAGIAIENRYAYEELERRAYFDYLTGLANRRYFLEQAESELARTLRYGGELSVIMFDVDHFKLVNDTHGHKIGDIVLKKIADICRTSLRDVDIIGRIGGEEFAILLPETASQQAVEAAERLRVALGNGRVQVHDSLAINFTASFGVTTVKDKEISMDTLLNQADQALYQAKDGGRNQVCVYRV